MISYIIRRILLMIPIIILISIVSFILIQLPPGDFLTVYRARLEQQETSVTKATLDRLEKRYGLDRSVFYQYYRWNYNIIVHGDFGESFLYQTDIFSLIKNRLGFTVLIGISTLIFTWIVGIPIGIYSATHQYKLSDHFFTFIGFVGLSLPNFLLALVLMFLSFVYFDVIPGGLFSETMKNAPWNIAKVIDLLKHLWIPVVVLGTAGTAGIIRVMRGNLLDVLGQDYIQTARAKGLKENVVIYKHAVRNAIHPLVMSLGYSLKTIISGATIVSIVLSLPTVGPLLFEALMSQDMFLAGTLILLQGILLVIGYLLADILLALVDPRVTYS